MHFNPRSPHGERRGGAGRKSRHEKISIHAPRTGSDYNLGIGSFVVGISIHAPRTGSDNAKRREANFSRISIHAPRTGSDGCLPV